MGYLTCVHYRHFSHFTFINKEMLFVIYKQCFTKLIKSYLDFVRLINKIAQ